MPNTPRLRSRGSLCASLATVLVGSLLITCPASAQERATLVRNTAHAVDSMAISPDGHWLALAVRDGETSFHLWDLDNHKKKTEVRQYTLRFAHTLGRLWESAGDLFIQVGWQVPEFEEASLHLGQGGEQHVNAAADLHHANTDAL